MIFKEYYSIYSLTYYKLEQIKAKKFGTMGNSNSKSSSASASTKKKKHVSSSEKETSNTNPTSNSNHLKPRISRTNTASNQSIRSNKSSSRRSVSSLSNSGNANNSSHTPDNSAPAVNNGSTSNNNINIHRRSHSQHIPSHSISNDDNSDDAGGTPKDISTDRTKLSNRRSSFNTTLDLPPSMVQMEPKPPILKNTPYTSSTNSFQYFENALTDEESDSNADVNPTKLSRQDSARRSHSSMRPSSIKSGSSNRLRRKSSETNVNIPDVLLNSRSNSFTSSLHSRKSSSSAQATAYSTPLNSPGLVRLDNDPNVDYFSMNMSNYGSNLSLSNGSNPTTAATSVATAGVGDADSDIHSLTKDQYPIQLPNDSMDQIMGLQQLQQPKKKKNLKPINIDETIQKLLDAGYAARRTKNVCLKNYEISQICHLAREIFLSQPSLLELSPPVKIVGDVHGQYGDLLRLFTKCGFPPSANYLFLGDYVDRGKQSLETILLLLCYKIKYPENFFLLRGNHECANVTRVYGFYDECKRRCNIKTWKLFIDTFNTLPLAAIVAGKIFCVHGGLSPVLNSMDEIRHVSRPTDVPDFGLINDLLWSDPTDSPNEWEDNERGVSYCYNKVAINKFLNKFGFDLVCRAHMVVEDGYEFFNDRSLVTVFSAPNYCGEFDNWGAVMSVSEGLLCSFELLDPLDSAALKQVMKKGRQERKIANQQQLQEFQSQE
ncbi:hypothetical protein KAFR_0C05490 [Kazachstania africana CBS 2517]|uniref:Serine/threonine-protein phosphatase n=1 Tax=Kazachstania africana (strain ATCC 22294 / BCRC 22015 / CBS 2517 / CECT 1963 / NBRC 1671 / NRRL Y-8276) TaxID=1071382 RepID=H2AT40_KAZAF|nr:hypothetical protein KAFR_0C05490 [Kazachstania africana CBS 2517]CCF57540.1 hypothetical protein KAFR_0C05490 [Kazachstania africana CBS 2517]